MACPAWVEINLDNLRFNFQQVRKIVGTRVKVLAAVKANAYGHGMVEVSRELEECGVDYLGVANVEEALHLKNAKIRTPVLILGSVFLLEEIKLALKFKVTITVADYKTATVLNRCADSLDKVKIHVKIDTGMGRLGIWHEQAEEVISKIIKLKNLIVEGIYTHFPSADSDRKFTQKQIDIFAKLLDKLEKRNIHIPFVHAANSVALCKLKSSHFNMIRPGLILYGIYPDPKLAKYLTLKPVLSFKTRIAFLKEVEAGRSISYGRTYVTNKKRKIATIAVGYADGYLRSLSNKGKVLIRGELASVIGRVCMDQTMIDVSNIAGVKLGDMVVLLGRQEEKIIKAEDLAKICNIIPYEITCGISSRVRRIFK